MLCRSTNCSTAPLTTHVCLQVFTEHTHIVAVKPTGNVYCWEAIDELCLKPKNMRDLLTGGPACWLVTFVLVLFQQPQNMRDLLPGGLVGQSNSSAFLMASRPSL